jgi:hypothetical protein
MLSAKMGSAGLATETRLAKGLLTAIAVANTVGADLHVITAPRVANLSLDPVMTESKPNQVLNSRDAGSFICHPSELVDSTVIIGFITCVLAIF